LPRYTVTRILPYTPQQLFDLVGDVEKYPEFVPWVTHMRVWNERPESDTSTALNAEAGVGFSFLRERFATRVRRNAATKVIDVGLISGPFRKLENRWSFHPDPAGTRIDFLIDFAFKVPLLDALLRANFDRAVGKLITCFEGRAKALYG
jgi:coenzyme Q-binding protein COQ10